MDAKKYFVLFLIAVLLNFYVWYFHVTAQAKRRLQPWKEALKRIG